MKLQIRNIADTARCVVISGAKENEGPDAVFHDPLVRRLASEPCKQIANAIEFSTKNSWYFVACTFLFDKYIHQQVKLGFDMIGYPGEEEAGTMVQDLSGPHSFKGWV